MAKQPKRKQVSLRIEAWQKAAALRDALAETTGRRVTITDTIDRALDCLADAHKRGAWLSPKEAGPVLEQRLRDQIASVLAQFVARALPSKHLYGITFHPNRRVVTVILEGSDGGEEPVPLLMGATEASSN